MSALVIGYLRYEIDALQQKYDTAIADLAVSEANVATLKSTVARQNQAVQALKAEKAALDAKVRENALKAAQMRREGVSIDHKGVDAMNDFFKRLFQ